MESDCSLQLSQVPATCRYPEPARSCPQSHFLTSWRSIIILSSHLSLGLPSGLFPLGFPTKTLYTPLLSPIPATCPVHFIILDLITRIFGEEAPHYVVISILLLPLVPLKPKHSPQHPILKHPQPAFLHQYKRPSFTPIHNRQNYSSVYTCRLKYVLPLDRLILTRIIYKYSFVPRSKHIPSPL